MNIPLMIVGFVIMAVAAFVNFSPDFFIKRFINLDNIVVDQNINFTDEELFKYKKDIATFKVKRIALLILLAGIIIIFIAAK